MDLDIIKKPLMAINAKRMRFDYLCHVFLTISSCNYNRWSRVRYLGSWDNFKKFVAVSVPDPGSGAFLIRDPE
jgi:hypothetical protein